MGQCGRRPQGLAQNHHHSSGWRDKGEDSVMNPRARATRWKKNPWLCPSCLQSPPVHPVPPVAELAQRRESRLGKCSSLRLSEQK